MRKKYLFTLAMAGLLLGACQNDEVNVPPASGNGAEWNAEGKGYVSLAINLPTQPSMLRAANDKFDDGTPEEYQVKDATLILFTAESGKSEAEATFHSAYNLKATYWNKPEGENITATTRIVQNINETPDAEKIYALVVLNSNGVLTVDERNSSLKVGNEDVNATMGLSDLNGMVARQVSQGGAWNTNSFLMSNAPLYTKVGGISKPEAGELQVLSEVDPSAIKATEEEARREVAAHVYVERAQAKVTLGSDVTQTDLADGPDMGEGKKMQYKVTGWVLDNTNKSSYLVRSYDNEWNGLASNDETITEKYRFVGSVPVADGLYRTYWGVDVNYGDEHPFTNYENDFNNVADADGHIKADVKMLKADGETPAYCFENTDNVKNMAEGYNTRVVVEAELNGGTPFYVVNDDKNTVYLDGDGDNGINTRIKADFLKDLNFLNWAKTNVKTDETISESELEVSLSGADNGGVKTIEVKLNETAKDELAIGADWNEISGCLSVANNYKVDYYAGGISYYAVYISHFGDDLTPWNNLESPKPSVVGTEANGIYPLEHQEGNYLGRWGVLRNNWYDLNVTGIRTIGSSTVPPVDPDEPIDKLEKYISMEINILAWALRTQNVEL